MSRTKTSKKHALAHIAQPKKRKEARGWGRERGKEEEKNSWQCKDACDSSRFDSASSFYIANIYSKEKKKTTNIKKKGRMRFRLDGSRSKLAHRGIVFLLNDGFQITEILDYRSVANRYFFWENIWMLYGIRLVLSQSNSTLLGIHCELFKILNLPPTAMILSLLYLRN